LFNRLRILYFLFAAAFFIAAPQTFAKNRVLCFQTIYFCLRTPRIPLKSRAIAKNPVDFSKILWICQKSRGFEKNPVDFAPLLVDLKKISWICLKSRGIDKNPVDFKKISWICFKSRGFQKNLVELLKIPCI